MPVSDKIDPAPKQPALVQVKRAKYLAIEGEGEPGGAEFQARLEALYGVAFTIKMAKKTAGRDYKVCALEALWWAMDQPRAAWKWKLLIRTPDFITARDLAPAVAKLTAKGKQGAGDVHLETIEEGKCVQVLHVGPYAEEAAAIGRMLEFAADPRRVAPDRRRTILRQPVR